MKRNKFIWTIMLGTTVFGLTACGIDMPKEVNTSFETMTVKKSDIELPYHQNRNTKKSFI